MNRKRFLSIFTVALFLIFITIFDSNVFAADPKLVSTLTGAFSKLESYIVKIATSFVAVAIATGLLMRKFSLGDEKKIYKANTLIKGSITSYVMVLCIDLILSLIENILT